LVGLCAFDTCFFDAAVQYILSSNLHRTRLVSEGKQHLAMLPDDMKHLINYDEKVAWVVHGSETVVVSDQRIILRKAGGLHLKKSFVDYPYSNMVNIKLERGVRRASVEIMMRSGVQSIKIANLSKADAYQLHRILRENVIRTSSQPGQPFPVIIERSQQSTAGNNVEGEQECGKCGRKISSDFALCPFCRYTLKVECPECAKQVDRKFKLCPYCGEDLSYLEEVDLQF
jgi:RNA polymerase subunit RPABC4/transcription elongation factor Spt4